MIEVTLHAFKPVVCLYLIIFIINLHSETLKSSFTGVGMEGYLDRNEDSFTESRFDAGL